MFSRNATVSGRLTIFHRFKFRASMHVILRSNLGRPGLHWGITATVRTRSFFAGKVFLFIMVYNTSLSSSGQVGMNRSQNRERENRA